MSVDAMSLLVKIQAQGVKQTEDALKGVSREGETSKGHLGGLLDTIGGFVGGAAIVNIAGSAFNFLKGQVTDSFKAGMDANTVIAQTAAVLRSTHDASGQTAQSISDFATKMLNLTGIDDDATQSAENMLATFTNIKGQAFQPATQAVLDMATAMNGGATPSAEQLRQTAIQVGKALNDPIQGVTTLQRVGVKLSDAQKAQVKHFMAVGDAADAQKVILKELNKEFGGSAAAAGQANGGIAILTAKFNNMKESLGQALIPMLVKLLTALQPITDMLTNGLTSAINGITPLFAQFQQSLKSPAAQQLGFLLGILGATIKTVGEQIKTAALPVLKQLGDFFQQHLLPAVSDFVGFAAAVLVPMFGQIATFIISTVGPAVIQLATFFTDTVLPAVESFIAWFRQNVLPVLMALVKVVVTDVLPTLEGLAKIFLEKVLPPVQRLIGLILPILIPAFKAIGWVISHVVGPVLGTLLSILGWLIGKVADVAEGIRNFIAGIGGAFSRFGTSVHNIIGRIGAAFVWLYHHNTYVKKLVDGIVAAFNTIKTKFTEAWNHVTSFIGGLASKLGTLVHDNIAKPIGDAMGKLIKSATDWGKNLIGNLISGISGKAGDLKNAATNALGGLAKILGFHSPAEEGPGADADTWAPNLIRMFAQGLAAGAPDLRNAAATAMAGVQGALSGAIPSLSGGVNVGITPAMMGGGVSAAGARSNVGAAGGGGAGGGQPVVLVLDGRVVARGLLPYTHEAIRLATGIRWQ